MKKIIMPFLILLASASSGFCQFKDYDVVFEDHKDHFEFFVTTCEEKSSMGSLVIYDMSIRMGEDCLPGVLSMYIHLDPKAAHLPALGPRKGHFVFKKGDDLPNIPNGAYEIMIDGVSYGQMVIDPDKGYYYPLEM